LRRAVTLRNIKEDLDDVGSNFDGAPDLEFRLATKAIELEQSGLSYQRVPPAIAFRTATRTRSRRQCTRRYLLREPAPADRGEAAPPPGDAELDRHVANAHAKPTPRGWRLVKSAEAAQIDGVIALTMAAERAEQRRPVAKVVGWI
jgi:hypothetical protein